jgi:Flp pilus assembly pilin Flp
VEYGLLAALISIAAVLTISLIGPLVDAMYQQVLAVLQTA